MKWEVAGQKKLNEVLSDARGYALKLEECFKYFLVRDCQDYRGGYDQRNCVFVNLNLFYHMQNLLN